MEFYVRIREKNIYYLIVNFYDDDDMLVKTLDTDEKLKNKGVLQLICQEEMQEESFFIMKEENKITYSYSEIKVNGEPGGEELFVWEKGKGLIEFGTGFGPGPQDVHIDEICEVTEDTAKIYGAKEQVSDQTAEPAVDNTASTESHDAKMMQRSFIL